MKLPFINLDIFKLCNFFFEREGEKILNFKSSIFKFKMKFVI